MRLIVVGACYLDTILSVPYYPGEDEKLRATSLVRRRGGNGPNTLEVLQQLVRKDHLSLSLCSVLPAEDSAAHKEIRRSLGPNVDVSTCIIRPDHHEAASSFIIRSFPTGSRTIVNYNDLPEVTTDEFVTAIQKLKDEECWFHFEGRIPKTTLACIKYLREHFSRLQISVEVEKPGREGLLDLATQADVVFISKTWAHNSKYLDARDCIQDQQRHLKRPRLLICTWGEQGATAFDRKSGAYEEVPAQLQPGCTVVDTTGAGDTFIAGVLYCQIVHDQAPIKDVLKYANRLAGRKVCQEGFQGLVEQDYSPFP